MFGGAGAFIGGFAPFVLGDYADVLPAGVPLFAFLIFQTVFCATAATIVYGSMAERTKFISYCVYSFCISAFIYPVSGRWIWGCGEQRGKTEGYFRGAKVEATMLPNMQVSIVVSKVPVSLVVNTARKALYTGNIGDGKIFISNVENVVKVRTGEQGCDALQDEEQQD